MIDLTKPIRSKMLKIKVQVKETHEFSVEGPGLTFHYVTLKDFEELYENIPGPRKPREWLIIEDHGADAFVAVDPNGFRGQHSDEIKIRVIEWPEGSPLPEWPEGYG